MLSWSPDRHRQVWCGCCGWYLENCCCRDTICARPSSASSLTSCRRFSLSSRRCRSSSSWRISFSRCGHKQREVISSVRLRGSSLTSDPQHPPVPTTGRQPPGRSPVSHQHTSSASGEAVTGDCPASAYVYLSSTCLTCLLPVSPVFYLSLLSFTCLLPVSAVFYLSSTCLTCLLPVSYLSLLSSTCLLPVLLILADGIDKLTPHFLLSGYKGPNL